MAAKQQDHWSSEAYQNAASFVPKLATKVVQWLDPQPEDRILDLGCGVDGNSLWVTQFSTASLSDRSSDGVLTKEIALHLTGSGYIHGTDSSSSMISTAQSSYTTEKTTYSIVDSTRLISESSLQQQSFDKVFSNAALHWILRQPSTRQDVFVGAFNALRPGGNLVFEMGGMGNVSEMRAALLFACARRIGIQRAREADPWFFPDVEWMSTTLKGAGFEVEKCELEYRATEATVKDGDKGGIEGWVRLMGKQFLDAVGGEGSGERESCVREVVDTLETVCTSPSGWVGFGYVRLRVLAKKP